MCRIVWCVIAFLACVVYELEGSPSDRKKYGEELNSRFILKTDSKMDVVAGIPLRASWWSRPHEYAWAAQFANRELVVLDAACGISHPFKWYLGLTCLETWACDSDPRIASINAIIRETYDDLGEIAYITLSHQPTLYMNVKLIRASICAMPISLPRYDRIFCISTLEHLCDKDRKDAMKEFSRVLAPGGLLILTVDYPMVTPEALIALADSVGLIPAGKVSMDRPKNGILTNGELSIYRCVLMHKNRKALQ